MDYGNPLAKDQHTAGNIDVRHLPSVPNPYVGGQSTVWSMGIGTPSGEVLIPRVKNGRVLSEDEAVDEYRRTGEHFGKFNTIEAASRFGEQLHRQQEQASPIANFLRSIKF